MNIAMIDIDAGWNYFENPEVRKEILERGANGIRWGVNAIGTVVVISAVASAILNAPLYAMIQASAEPSYLTGVYELTETIAWRFAPAASSLAFVAGFFFKS